jgi:hypothetical protein
MCFPAARTNKSDWVNDGSSVSVQFQARPDPFSLTLDLFQVFILVLLMQLIAKFDDVAKSKANALAGSGLGSCCVHRATRLRPSPETAGDRTRDGGGGAARTRDRGSKSINRCGFFLHDCIPGSEPHSQADSERTPSAASGRPPPGPRCRRVNLKRGIQTSRRLVRRMFLSIDCLTLASTTSLSPAAAGLDNLSRQVVRASG